MGVEVAGAAQGLDALISPDSVAELSAKAADVHINAAVEWGYGPPKRALCQLVARHHATGRPQQCRQNIKFGSREFYQFARAFDPS